MSKPVIIVESPTKTRTLKRFLGDEYTLLASKGHVRDLPEDGLAVDVEHDFKPKYQIIPRQKKTMEELRKKLQHVDTVYLASDPDREGEAIAWGLAEELKLSNPLRIEFNEITEQAVREALAHPTQINYNRVNAQQSRRILDRLVGYKLSPLLYSKISSARRSGVALSAGRVQSVALRLVCDREREIDAFDAVEYWTIDVALSTVGGPERFSAALKTKDGEELELKTREQVDPVVTDLARLSYAVANVDRKQVRRNPQPPFITSTLQRAASGQLGLAARQTMRIAQQLYEGVDLGEGAVGLITYMRTDSMHIADQARTMAQSFIKGRYGNEYVGPGAKGRKVKGAQEAHEAIRPAEVTRTPEAVRPFLTEEQAKLYELIWRRFVASQMSAAIYDQTGVDINAGPYGLRTTASVLRFPGFQAVMPEREDENEKVQLPELAPDQALEQHEISPDQHFTKPPARYNEGTLIAALEENGIGRPSTYAPIVETLRQRKYVRMQQRAFIPTPLGFSVCDFLVANFPQIMDVDFTARVEADLDTVESGELDWVQLLHNFYSDFEELVVQAEQAPLRTLEGEVCPKCGGKLLERYTVFGKFAGCENYPECDFTRDLLPESVRGEAPQELDEKCPDCAKALVIRTGRRGPFIGCVGYPECTYTRPMEGEGQPGKEPPKELGEACPDCKKALVIRTGRRGPFIACTGYPKCTYTRPMEGEEKSKTPAKVRAQATKTDIPCEECGKPMAVRSGRRGPFLGCSGYPKCRATRDLTDAEKQRWLESQPAVGGEAGK